MNLHPLPLSIPNGGLIVVTAKEYDTITDNFIQTWLHDLYRDFLAEPDYLLVSEQVRRDLECMVREDMYMHMWIMDYSRNNKQPEAALIYPNKITGHHLSIVVFPDLPEKTIFAASMLKMKSEASRMEGSTRVITREFMSVFDK